MRPKARAGVFISWTRVALASSIIAVGAVTGLAIVAAVKDVDALSAIALALAITAFVIQIIVFIAQTWTTSQLNAETRGFLHELRTSTQGTERVLGVQVDKLTDHLVGKTVAAATATQKGEFNLAEFRQSVRQDVREVVAEASGQSGVSAEDLAHEDEESVPTPEDLEIAQHLSTFPDQEEGLRSLEILDALSPWAVSALRRLGDDEEKSRKYGGTPGLPMRMTATAQELKSAGLLEAMEPQWETDHSEWGRLTAKGRQVARLLIAEGEPPEYLVNAAAAPSTAAGDGASQDQAAARETQEKVAPDP